MLHKRNRNNLGFTMIYAMFATVVMMAFTSLAVDWGRVETAKTELQDATDAAARYAATGISDGTAATKAISAASQNDVDGSTMVLQSSDVTVGTWNSTTRTFTAGGSSPNAVSVTGHRTKARGTGIPLLFAKVIGMTACDINTTSIAQMASTTASADIVGLASVSFGGSAKIQRLSSESGSVTVGSNGTYSLTWGQQIVGNALYVGSAPNTPNGANCITGTQTQITSNLSYATPTTPSGCTSVGAANYGNGQVVPVPGGNYSATSLTIGGGATLNLSGDVNVYCSGAVNLSNGCIINTNNGAYKFTIYQTTASTVYFNMGTIYARVYAPLSTVTVDGSTTFNGSVISNKLINNSIINYSSALPSPIAATGGSGSGGSISMVK